MHLTGRSRRQAAKQQYNAPLCESACHGRCPTPRQPTSIQDSLKRFLRRGVTTLLSSGQARGSYYGRWREPPRRQCTTRYVKPATCIQYAAWLRARERRQGSVKWTSASAWAGDTVAGPGVHHCTSRDRNLPCRLSARQSRWWSRRSGTTAVLTCRKTSPERRRPECGIRRAMD